MDTKWNQNGNWLATASRDHLVKVFDIRNLKEEMQTFKVNPILLKSMTTCTFRFRVIGNVSVRIEEKTCFLY